MATFIFTVAAFAAVLSLGTIGTILFLIARERIEV